MKPFSIYYLVDPTNQRVRYIGYSCRPEKRYISHVLQATNCRTHKECWIASLLEQGLYPTLSIRCIVDGSEEAKRVEIALIATLRQRGVDLVNTTRGGDGSAGFKWSPENYRRHQEYWDSGGRQKLSLLKKGRPQTQQQIAAVMAANTPELLARRGAAIKAGWARRQGAPTTKKGRPSNRRPNLGKRWQMTDEQKQTMRNSWTPERRTAQAERMRKARDTEDATIEIRRQLVRAERKLARLRAALADAK